MTGKPTDRPIRLLFVCSGNICRSPMAEAIATAAAPQLGLAVECASAGTLNLVDRAPPPNAMAVMREVGLSIQDHRSQPLTLETIRWADHVLCMTVEHAVTAHARDPQAGEKVRLLGPYGGQASEIDDPMGRWRPAYRRARKAIERAAQGFLERLRDGDL